MLSNKLANTNSSRIASCENGWVGVSLLERKSERGKPHPLTADCTRAVSQNYMTEVTHKVKSAHEPI